MSLANDLLRNLSATQVDEQDDTLIIDHYTRTIIIPKHITNLGVENDDDVLRLHFRMPRYLGKIDLSAFTIRISYINAAGEDDEYDVADVAVVGDNLTFSWEVGPIALAYKGDTQFAVNVIKVKSDGTRDKKYGTTPATLPVLEGLETGEGHYLEYADLIEQWRQQLFGIGDTEEAKLIAASEAEQQNIVNKGAEVLATIPADYTAAVNAANKAERTKADAIVCSAEGELITVNDSSDDYLRGLSVFGKTTQVKTTGKNLLDDSDFVSGLTQGIYYSRNSDGSFRMSGVASSTNVAINKLGSINMIAGTRYVISGAVDHMRLSLRDDTMGNVYADDSGSGTVYVPDENMVAYLYARVEKGDSINATFYPMVRLESVSDSTWEPASGGMVTPCPEYPRELTSVNEPTINVYGNNLFPVAETTAYNVTGTPQADGSITYTGTSNGNAWHAYQDCPISVSGKYAMTVQTTNGTNKGSLVQLFDSRGAIVKSWIIVDENHLAVFDAEAGGKVRWNIGVEPDEVVNTNVKLMLNVGDTALPWEPYVGQQVISLTNHGLPGIPVTSGGNYTDSNGQQWICDEIDFERGVYVKRINEISLPSTFVINESTNEMWIQLNDSEAAARNTTENQCICTHFPATSRQEIYDRAFEAGYRAIAVRDRFVRVVDNVTFNANPDALNAWIAEQNSAGVDVLLKYILETPIENPLTQAEIDAFKALHTNYPNITVMNDVGAHMGIMYNADTKTYLDAHLRPTTEIWTFTLDDGSTVTKAVHVG